MAQYHCTVCGENYFFKPDKCQDCGNVVFEKDDPESGGREDEEDRFVTKWVVIATLLVFVARFPLVTQQLSPTTSYFEFFGYLAGALAGAFILVAGLKFVYLAISKRI